MVTAVVRKYDNSMGNIKMISLILVSVLVPSYSFISSLLHYCTPYIYDFRPISLINTIITTILLLYSCALIRL